MSDTPRTDAEVVEDDNGLSGYVDVVDADFARQLERELAEANSIIRKLRDGAKNTATIIPP